MTTTTTPTVEMPVPAPMANLDEVTGEMAAKAEAKFGRSFDAAVDKLATDVAAAGARVEAFTASLWADVDGLTEWAEAKLGPKVNRRGWVPEVPDEADRDHALAELVRHSGPGTVDLWADDDTPDQPATTAAVEAYYANEDDDTTVLPASYLRKVSDHFRGWLRPASLTSPGEVS